MIYLGDIPLSKGRAGSDGKSAYKAAVDGGYTGTEAQLNGVLSTLHAQAYSSTQPTNQDTGDYWFEPIESVNV